jgi:hypothetical protein
MMRINAVNGLELKYDLPVNYQVRDQMPYHLVVILDLYPVVSRMWNTRLVKFDRHRPEITNLR